MSKYYVVMKCLSIAVLLVCCTSCGPDGLICRTMYPSASTETERRFWDNVAGPCNRRVPVHSADPSEATSAGMTSELHLAAGLGDIARVTKLLEQGADVNAGGPAAGNVPAGCAALMLAAARNHEDMVKFLLSRGADPNQSDQGGGTALIYASWKGYKDTVSVLLVAGADPDATTRDGRSALSVARQSGHNEVVTILESATKARILSRLAAEPEVKPASRTAPLPK